MNDSIEHLVSALREELQQYGEMLALLNRQQRQVMDRAGEEVIQVVHLIQGQGTRIENARAQRENCRRCVAVELGQAQTASFNVLIPLFPADYRPLVKALVDENNELLVRVHQRARQNHLLLSRSLELMQNFLNHLFPSRETRVYDDHGGMQTRSVALRALYEGVG